MKDIRFIEEIALKFRLAVENLAPKDFDESTWFSKFPKGCCGDTSELLSKYLMENGIVVEYVNGVWNTQWHAWLEYMEYIIDITADQFPGIRDKVVITTDKYWHSKFNKQTRRYLDFEIDNKLNKVRLRKLYNNIIAKMQKNN